MADPVSVGAGISFFAAALPICVGAIGTGMAMSSIGAAAMGYLAEKEGAEGKALLFVALPETMIILGFVMSFLILNAIGAPAAK